MGAGYGITAAEANALLRRNAKTLESLLKLYKIFTSSASLINPPFRSLNPWPEGMHA